MHVLHLDLETFCKADIRKVGTYRYCRDPSLGLLLACWALGTEAVHVDEGIGSELHEHLSDPSVLIVAFNAEFERQALRALGYDLPPERFLCTAVLAYMLSFTGLLENVCQQMEFPQDKQKLARAKRMMMKFCKPRRPSKKDSRDRWTPDMDLEGWVEFREYGAQDVVASREIYAFASRYPVHPLEREMWCLDQRINDTGWPIDTGLVQNANALRVAAESRLLGVMKDLTGLENPNSRDQMLGWLHGVCGVKLPNLQIETVAETCERLEQIPDPDYGGYKTALPVLRLRQRLARATPKKWDALARATDTDGRLRGTLKFAGASRTQRWSGKLFQPQNLFSEREHDPDCLAEVLKHGDLATVTGLYGDAQRALSGGIRSAVTAGEGNRLVVCDKSGIESRALGWLAGEERINGIFRRGEDTYKDLASRVFGVPVSEVTKAQRTFCKPAELGCGYKLSGGGIDGTGGLVAYAASMGVTIDLDRATAIVDIWRQSNPCVVQMWEWFDAVIPEVVTHGTVFDGYKVRIRRDDRFLIIDLPSGRPIYYFRPVMAVNDFGRWVFSYMGRYQDEGGRWQRVYSHAGKVTENIDQAFSRDCLRDDLRAIAAEVGYATIIGHVHDEAVCEVPTELADMALGQMTEIMARSPSYALDLVLAAEGFICRRYRKG